MNDSGGPYFDINNSPFCPATGKLTRLFKGGTPEPKAMQAASATSTNRLVGQATEDDDYKNQEKRRRNESVLASSKDQTFGQKLKLGL